MGEDKVGAGLGLWEDNSSSGPQGLTAYHGVRHSSYKVKDNLRGYGQYLWRVYHIKSRRLALVITNLDGNFTPMGKCLVSLIDPCYFESVGMRLYLKVTPLYDRFDNIYGNYHHRKPLS